MKGIIQKDLYELFGIRENLANVLGSIIIVGILLFVTRDTLGFALLNILEIPVFSFMTLYITMESDEKSHFDTYQFVYPISKRNIVLCKYIIGMVCQMCISIMILCLIPILVYGYKMIEWSVAMKIWGTGMIFSVLMLSISYVIFFSFGSKVGIFLSALLDIVVMIGYVLVLTVFYDKIERTDSLLEWNVERVVYLSSPMAFVVGGVVGVIGIVGSYMVSVRLYQRKLNN